MKYLKLQLLVLLVALCVSSYGQDFPWKKYGLNPKVLTLSNGKYQEFHDMETVVQIGSVYFNTETRKIVGFVKKDSTSKVLSMDAHTVSRWMSPDPLTEEYSSWSPYNYVKNNPIRFVDPDGRDGWDVIKGIAMAISDNALLGTTSMRETATYSNCSHYNTGQNIGDAISIVLGVDLTIGGGTIAGVGTAATASVVSVPLTVEGAAIVTHGVTMTSTATANLMNQKGRVEEGDSRNQAQTKAKDHSKVPRESKGGENIGMDKLNKSSQGKNYRKMKENGANSLGRKNPNGKNYYMEHPDGHNSNSGKASHHNSGHFHSTNANGETKIYKYKK